MSVECVIFPPFHLDVANVCLYRSKRKIPLTPKDFAVLRSLVLHAGRLVIHNELLKTIWPDTVVDVGVLKVCIRRIRQALNLAAQQASGALMACSYCLSLLADAYRTTGRPGKGLQAVTEARQMLGESYGWFTEGFRTADWHKAKALLAAWE